MTNNKKSTCEGMDPIIRDVVRGDFERKIQDLISNGRSARTVAARLVESMPMSAIRLIGAEHLQSAMAIDRGASSVDADPVNPADIAELRRTFRDRLIAGFPAGVNPPASVLDEMVNGIPAHMLNPDAIKVISVECEKSGNDTGRERLISFFTSILVNAKNLGHSYGDAAQVISTWVPEYMASTDGIGQAIELMFDNDKTLPNVAAGLVSMLSDEMIHKILADIKSEVVAS